MNLPNKLTVLRMLLIPVFLVFALIDTIPFHYLWAAVIFGAAAFTDYLDGHIARKYHLITDFGKFMDPLADKLLVVSALVCFVASGWASTLVVIVILAREFLVTSVRLIAANNGQVIAADIWGKMKTVLQIIWILSTLLTKWYLLDMPVTPEYGLSNILGWVLMIMQYAVLAMTVFSGFNYVWKNRNLFSDVK